MSITTAKRSDVFAWPVRIAVRGWFNRPLAQIRCGLTALRLPVAARRLQPANDC